MGVAFEVVNGVLPISCENILVLAAKALMNLCLRNLKLALRSEWEFYQRFEEYTYIRPRSRIKVCWSKSLGG